MTEIPRKNNTDARSLWRLNFSFKKIKPNRVAIIILASRMEETYPISIKFIDQIIIPYPLKDMIEAKTIKPNPLKLMCKKIFLFL